MSDERLLAELEFESGNYLLAAQFAGYWLAKDPDAFAAWELMGHASLKLGRFEEGIDALEQAALLKPQADVSRIELAIAYGVLGRSKLSCDLLMLLVVSGNCSPSDLLRIAVGLDVVGQPRLAVEACRNAGRKQPGSAEIQHQMAAYLLKSGQPVNLAETLLHSAVKLEPANIEYRISLASLLSGIGRRNEAIECLRHSDSAQLASVRCICCLTRLANLFFDGGEIELAKHCAAQAALLQDA